MGLNARLYFEYEQRRLEPDQHLRGNYRGHKDLLTAMSDKNAWYNSLTDAEREQLRVEAEYEEQKKLYQQ